MVYRSRLTGWGAYLPERIVTNDELARRIDTTDEWIVQRTGIRQRHVAADGELTSDLAVNAALEALRTSGKTAADIDLLIVATTTPDETFPSTATKVQARLGMIRGAAFDVQAVCAGFIYALAIADNFIKAGQAKNVLVIGAETFTRLLDWEDRGTCVLFGDGAGAVLLTAEQGSGANTDRGILSTHLHSDGREHDALYVDGGPSSTGTVGHVRMVGREVYKHAVLKLGAVIEEALSANELTSADIDWLVPHQANRRIIDGMRQRFGLPEEKVVLCIDRHANTSAASVPLALAEAMNDGRIKPGDLVLLEAIGGGLAWGAGLLRV
ncbi:MAG: ketoacyl-ACP synthase III [Alphaproteobacteria bacterium]|nr:ketoacyl-ACP synthase III [Alphaproteobacteria bacterium]MBU0797764.1 ketoacyl-ACP synthase III [Alphaproteobacteria bacterium]MBU0887826.1 ketoacyl-ACP synthase III [Alphaproteobacteria bacterium]MBU1814951.1 ketoacyl-ACP synthase III [Alphaproteobacteria bacterium]